MTSEQQDPLLASLLQNTDATASHASDSYQPPLSRDDEQRLLHEANQVGTPTLGPRDAIATSTHSRSVEESFASDIVEFIRRYPVPTLLAVVGAAYLLTRRSSR